MVELHAHLVEQPVNLEIKQIFSSSSYVIYIFFVKGYSITSTNVVSKWQNRCTRDDQMTQQPNMFGHFILDGGVM